MTKWKFVQVYQWETNKQRNGEQGIHGHVENKENLATLEATRKI